MPFMRETMLGREAVQKGATWRSDGVFVVCRKNVGVRHRMVCGQALEAGLALAAR
jgi:hypothetical protein